MSTVIASARALTARIVRVVQHGHADRARAFATRVAVPPEILSSTQGAWVTLGAPIALQVTATGPELTYQWYERKPEDVVVEHAKDSSYTTTATAPSRTFFCRVYSGNVWVDSAPALLDVINAALDSTAKMRRLQYAGEESAREFQRRFFATRTSDDR